MGSTERRCTSFFLSFVILLLGVGSTVLLYYAGQNTVDLFWGDTSTYKDKLGRINRRVVTDDWYGLLALRGWAFGLLYVVPGLSGVTAALFYNRPTMIAHFVIAILALVPGSVLHSIGAVGLVMYRLLVIEGASRYNPWLGDCIYVRDNAAIPYEYEDHKCVIGRRALLLAISAVGVLFVAWLFVFSHVLYCAFTYSALRKHVKKVELSTSKSGEYSPLLAQTHAVEESTDIEQVPGTSQASGAEQASGVQQASVVRKPHKRGKKVAPPVPPQSSAGSAISEDPQPSVSTEAAVEDAGDKQTGRDGGSQNISGTASQSGETNATSTEDVMVMAQGDPGDSDKQPVIVPAEESQTGESMSHTATFMNAGYDSS